MTQTEAHHASQQKPLGMCTQAVLKHIAGERTRTTTGSLEVRNSQEQVNILENGWQNPNLHSSSTGRGIFPTGIRDLGSWDFCTGHITGAPALCSYLQSFHIFHLVAIMNLCVKQASIFCHPHYLALDTVSNSPYLVLYPIPK